MRMKSAPMAISLSSFGASEAKQRPVDELRAHTLAVLIENDQSTAADSIFQPKRFFRKASEGGLNLGMTQKEVRQLNEIRGERYVH